jgi:hypothetical protein
MIQALRYEPQGQRQRFEPPEQQSGDRWHTHLHLHLHLGMRVPRVNLGMRVPRASHSPVARVTTIFAAFIGALAMALTLGLQGGVRAIPTQLPLFSLAGNLIFAGTLLGSIAVLLGGIPLVVSAWRSTWRSGDLFVLTLLVLGSTIVFGGLVYALFGNIGLALCLYGVPLLCTIMINRALHQAALADKWLHFANQLSRLVVVGMVLMLVGVVLWGVALALFAPGWFVVLLPLLAFPWDSWLLIALGMLLAVIVAVFASFWQGRPSASQPRRKDASFCDVTSSRERGYYPVD